MHDLLNHVVLRQTRGASGTPISGALAVLVGLLASSKDLEGPAQDEVLKEQQRRSKNVHGNHEYL